eukprot:TRINITY_DN23791_c0_g1_i1.p1 TRINITY_DN23791_c0_g1~~TRINITY_DN23791_c0_g1_i1.p1  ORF type:complete len:343 (+),score=99.17 TRINITY_DN23791_c0_g1_i1:56-1030(+)
MGKKRGSKEMEEEVVDDRGVEKEEEEEDMEEDEEEEEEEEQVHKGDEVQEVLFDVDVMEGSDQDGVFHILQRWVPPAWCCDIDKVVNKLGESEITSIIKIPDQPDPEVNLGDDRNDIYGAVGIIDISTLPDLVQRLSTPATTEEVTKKDLGAHLTPEALSAHPVGLVVSERLVNLPAELGSQLHVNLFEEISQSPISEKFEYYLIIARVRMRADEELDEMDKAREQAMKEAGVLPKKQTKQPKKKLRSKLADGALAITEDTCLFPRPEEIFYFRNRHVETATKRFILDPDISADVVVAPILVHKTAIPKVVEGIKTLDSYFLEH